MNLDMENQTLLYIIIGVFIVQFLILRYYVLNTVEKENKKNNKRLIKKVSKQINSTFDKYMGNSIGIDNISNIQQPIVSQNNDNIDIDSIDDPADDIDE
jgi:beta-lactamase regulating signal transducer with metallopeptidase domain